MSPNLLLMEDDSRLRHDLDVHFRQHGFAVTACATGVHSTQVSTAIECPPGSSTFYIVTTEK